eukprot:1180415-Prorocentrum_minimum.AAC.4
MKGPPLAARRSGGGANGGGGEEGRQQLQVLLGVQGRAHGDGRPVPDGPPPVQENRRRCADNHFVMGLRRCKKTGAVAVDDDTMLLLLMMTMTMMRGRGGGSGEECNE